MSDNDETPRRLRLLRIEDENKRWPKPQLLEDLPQIGEWRPFFEDLVRLRGTDAARSRPPDILAVDFGFQGDGTLPKVPDERHEHVELFGQELADRFRWSNRLGQPNTGLIIATAVLSQWAGRDFPMVIALHSAATKEVLADVSSALLAAQLMALGGTWSGTPGVRHPLVDLHEALERNKLPKVASTAVSRVMPVYRTVFLERTGSIPSGSQIRPRLFLDPIAIARLQQLLVSGGTADDIGPQLDCCGIVVVDLHGTRDVLDLRSVFCDKEIGTWQAEPSDTPALDVAIREPAAFVTLLRSTTEGAYREAASIVQNNKDRTKEPQQIEEGKDWPKYLALAFALVEDAILQHERMNASWDPLEDQHDKDPSKPSLGEHCIFIAAEWHRWCQDQIQESGDEIDFVRFLARRKLSDVQVPSAQWLGAQKNGDFQNCIENILRKLSKAGILVEVNKQKRSAGKATSSIYRLKFSVDEVRDDDGDFHLIRSAVRKGLCEGDQPITVRLATLLGFHTGKQNYSTQVHRIEGFGDSELAKRIHLVDLFRDTGSVPAIVRAPIRWYLSEYHHDENLPPILAGFRTQREPPTTHP